MLDKNIANANISQDIYNVQSITILYFIKVNKDFDSRFSTFLPGAKAKLRPPQNEMITDGLKVKVEFSDVWKESLRERVREH